ncbi:MAG: PIN domain-containing protein [Acidobacteriota bacterium]
MSPKKAAPKSARTFLDTNVLVYLFDADEPAKQAAARRILNNSEIWGDPILSTQVLQELYVVTTRKLSRPLAPPQALEVVRHLLAYPVVQLDGPHVTEAIELSQRHQLSLWDALILTAARAGGCSRVLTEDLHDGLEVEGVRVENPFREVA